eukprot:SAG25_NODE_1754_length_2392_cov_1.389446_1_plen_235_part_10
MTRYGFFTFKPHASDTKQLMEQMLALLQPQIKKLTKQNKGYLLGIDYPGQPNEHIHFVFPIGEPTVQKVEQFINNTGIKKLIQNLKNTNTDKIHGFKYILVKDTEEDVMRTIGYCAKESIKYTNGFTQEHVSKCVNLFWTYKNLDSKIKINTKSIKTLKPNEVLTYMEEFVIEHKLDYADPYIMTKMKEARISFVQVSRPQREIIKNEFILMNKEKIPDFVYNVAKHSSNKDEDD